MSEQQGRKTPRSREEVVGRERREAWRSHGLKDLLERRPDLEGVHRPADFAVEAVLWSV
ncbi:hypothetical protein ACFP3Q_14040 [Nocardioides sp. GCM10027113]|uniref:hypothetical protein n=1 Tax=unclassified Nocardioides TaxID=2615069 RepID=UPI0036166417